MEGEVPVLEAAAPPYERVAEPAAAIAPAAWALSAVVHVALLAAFLDRTAPLPPPPPSIEVKVVFDAPLVEAPAAAAGADQALGAVGPADVAPAGAPPVDLAAVLPADMTPVEPTVLPPVADAERPAAVAVSDSPSPAPPPPAADPAPPAATVAAFAGPPAAISAAVRDEPAPAPAASAPAASLDPSPSAVPASPAVPAAAVASAVPPPGAAPAAESAVAAPAAVPAPAADAAASPALPILAPAAATAERGPADVPALAAAPAAAPLAVALLVSAATAVPAAAASAVPAPEAALPVAPVALTALPEAFALDRAALARAVSGLDCSRVNVAINEDLRSVAVSGHVRSAEDRDRLAQTIAALGDIVTLSLDGLHVVGEPYCRVLSFLNRPELSRSADQKLDAASIGQPAESGALALTGGNPLRLALRAPDFASYLYVDYFTSDGHVFHLLPDRQSGDAVLAPGEAIAIGGLDGRGLKATIGPPYGLDMVVALASETPLPLPVAPVGQPAHQHLDALAAAIAAAKRSTPGLRLEYSYFLIRTSAR